MDKQPTPIRRGSLDEAYDTVTKDADVHPVDKPRGLLQAVTMATKANGDMRIAINLSTVLATIFGVIVLAVAGRVFLNAVALSEVKILLEMSSTAQVEFRMQANTRFQTLESNWKREVDLIRNEIQGFEENMNAMWYRVRRVEDKLGNEGGASDFEKTK